MSSARPGVASRMTLNRYLAPLKPGRAVLLGANRCGSWPRPRPPGKRQGSRVLVDGQPFRPLPAGAPGQGTAWRPRALARVQVAGLHLHQLVRLLQEILPAALKPGALVVLLGPVSLFHDEQVPLTERRRLFKDLTRLLGSIKSQSALLLLQPRLPKAAANQHFGRLLAPVVDYMVRVREEENLRGGPGDFFVSDPPPSLKLLPTPIKIIGGWASSLCGNAPAEQETAVIFAPLKTPTFSWKSQVPGRGADHNNRRDPADGGVSRAVVEGRTGDFRRVPALSLTLGGGPGTGGPCPPPKPPSQPA
jgi:hypothetical protein